MWFFGRKNKKNKPTKSKFCVGLALSGGGTRGFAHLGVFKALEEHNVHVDCVAGTSAGALMGALYCAQIPWQKVVEQGKLVKKSDVLNKRLAIGSDAHNVGKLADRLLCGKTFEMLPIPFSAVSVDLATGNEIVLNTGSLADAISASAAVPVLFSPVKMGEMSLVDGGLLNNLPADVCRTMGAEVVIGVDLNHLRGSGTKSDKFFDTLLATWEITTKSSVYKGQMNSDVIIEPELSAYKNTSLSNIDEMVQAGYQATIEKMDEIKRLLQID